MRRIVIKYIYYILVSISDFMLSIINILVNKLWKSYGKIINNETVKTLIQKINDIEVSDAKVYKITHVLRNKGYLISIKKNYFLCTQPNKIPDNQDIIQDHYRDLLKKHCQTFLTWGRYIWWIKALELHIQNYEIPENIDIVNLHKNAVEVIMFDHMVSYKTYTYKQVNIFTKIKKHLVTQKIGRNSFPCANIELAILESLHNPSKTKLPLITEYIKKAIRKYKKTINFDRFGIMLNNNKHHVGINRLYQISKSIDPDFANKIHTIIKKYSFVMQAGK